MPARKTKGLFYLTVHVQGSSGHRVLLRMFQVRDLLIILLTCIYYFLNIITYPTHGNPVISITVDSKKNLTTFLLTYRLLFYLYIFPFVIRHSIGI